jgi:Cyclin, N-terminal domain
LVSCFVASKLEDRRCIRMNEVLREAGHGKFTRAEITAAEQEIYQTLTFDMSDTTLVDEVLIVERTVLPPKDIKEQSPIGKTDLELISTFVAKAYVHDVKLTALPLPSQVYTTIAVAVDLYRDILNLKSIRQSSTMTESVEETASSS